MISVDLGTQVARENKKPHYCFNYAGIFWSERLMSYKYWYAADVDRRNWIGWFVCCVLSMWRSSIICGVPFDIETSL